MNTEVNPWVLRERKAKVFALSAKFDDIIRLLERVVLRKDIDGEYRPALSDEMIIYCGTEYGITYDEWTCLWSYFMEENPRLGLKQFYEDSFSLESDYFVNYSRIITLPSDAFSEECQEVFNKVNAHKLSGYVMFLFDIWFGQGAEPGISLVYDNVLGKKISEITNKVYVDCCKNESTGMLEAKIHN